VNGAITVKGQGGDDDAFDDPAGLALDNPDLRKLLNLLPDDGTAKGNHWLREHLHWSLDHYLKVRGQLVTANAVELGRGYGGSVRRTGAIDPNALRGPATSELQLYRAIDTQLAEWCAIQRRTPLTYRSQVLGTFRTKAVTGTWTHPDLVAVGVKRLPLTGRVVIEVMSFEVKLAKHLDVTAIHEALAQRRRATHAWVMADLPEGSTPPPDVVQEAAQHHIGLVTIADPGSYATWSVIREASRVEPDPEELEQLITALNPEVRDFVVLEMNRAG